MQYRTARMEDMLEGSEFIKFDFVTVRQEILQVAFLARNILNLFIVHAWSILGSVYSFCCKITTGVYSKLSAILIKTK